MHTSFHRFVAAFCLKNWMIVPCSIHSDITAKGGQRCADTQEREEIGVGKLFLNDCFMEGFLSCVSIFEILEQIDMRQPHLL